jgi:hypothetical protein
MCEESADAVLPVPFVRGGRLRIAMRSRSMLGGQVAESARIGTRGQSFRRSASW